MRTGKHAVIRELRRGRTLAVLTVLAMLVGLLVAVPGAGAAELNAEYFSHTGTLYPTGGSIAAVVAAPDDGGFLQMGPGSEIVMMFPVDQFALPDGNPSTPDLRVDVFDAAYPALAEVWLSSDGVSYWSEGLFADTANINLDLGEIVKYVRVVQDEFCDPGVDASGYCIDQDYPTLGFDLDAVVALNGGVPAPTTSCEPGDYFVSAYGIGSATPVVTTADLEVGHYYDITAYGWFYAGGWAVPGGLATHDIRADAEYSETRYARTNALGWTDVPGTAPGDPYSVYNYAEDYFELYVGVGGPLAAVEWGAYNSAHRYTLPSVIGSGDPMQFQFQINEGYAQNDIGGLCVSLTELNRAPVADANGPYTGTFSNPVLFDGSGSWDPDEDAMTYAWDFGDGNTGSGVEPTHTYATEGPYTVTLVVTDENGASDTTSTTATIGVNPYTRAEDCVGDEFFVPSNPMLPVTTAPLVNGHEYVITASGTYYAGGIGVFDIQADAEYSQNRHQRTNGLGWSDLVYGYESTDTGLLDLWLGIGGTPDKVDWPGGYNSSHVYTMTVVGSGAPAEFEFQVYDTVPSNNVGGLCVSAERQNRVPTVLSAAGDANGNEGDTLATSGSFEDDDFDALALTADNGAMGTFIDNGDGTWDWSYPTTDNGDGTITVTADDGYGGVATDSFDYSAANVAPSVGPIAGAPVGPIAVGTTVTLSAPFTDPGTSDTHDAVWSWGDGSGATISPTTSSMTYGAAGIYNESVTVTVTDDDGGSGTATLDFQVVVYDPSAGFVTGGGWFYSDAGNYIPDTALEGKATFGFVAKYKKGAKVPEGNTEFQFKAGDLNFHSTSYEWLVITGEPSATFKGVGTINGEGGYKFMLTAGDSSPDTFRMQIWDADDNKVYDNGPNQAIGGGSIIIHTAKK